VGFRLKELLPGVDRSNLTMIDLVQDPAKTRDVAGVEKQEPFHLAPNGATSVAFDLVGAQISPIKRYQSVLTVSNNAGTKFTQVDTVDFLTAARLAQSPRIDGDLSDWANVPAITLSGLENVVRSPQSYPSGFSTALRYAWDAKALYIAAEVSDDTFFQEYTGAMTWRNDCLQLAFNLDPGISNNAPDAGKRRTSEIVVALTKNGPEASRNLSYAPDKLALGIVLPQQLGMAIKRVGPGGSVYEIAIPWSSLGFAPGQSPKAGDRIGVAATINEVRSADQGDPTALGIFGGIVPDKDVDKQGTLVLAP